MFLFLMIMLPIHYGNPKQARQSIQIYIFLMTTCPVQALQYYVNMITLKQLYHFAISAGTFSPLSRSQLTTEVRQLLFHTSMC